VDVEDPPFKATAPVHWMMMEESVPADKILAFDPSATADPPAVSVQSTPDKAMPLMPVICACEASPVPPVNR
jgi:hypothetical protein